MKIIFVMCLVASATAVHYQIHPKDLTYAEFAGDDKDLILPEDNVDEPPTIYNANVQQAKTLMSVVKNHGRGKFKTTFQTENGIQINQVGKLKDSKTFVVKGSYSYTGPDGKRYRVRYTADEFGYHPITELDVDIPDIEGPQVAVKPVAPLKPLNLFARPLISNDDLPPSNGYVPPQNNAYIPPSNNAFLTPNNNGYIPPPPTNQYNQEFIQNIVEPVEDRRYLPPPPPVPVPSRAYLPVN